MSDISLTFEVPFRREVTVYQIKVVYINGTSQLITGDGVGFILELNLNVVHSFRGFVGIHQPSLAGPRCADWLCVANLRLPRQ